VRIVGAIAGTIGSVILAIALAKGHFQWLPDWLLLVVFLGCAALWLAANENVRALAQLLWTRRVAGDLVDSHGRPARYPRRIGKRGAIAALVITGFAVVTSIAAWQIAKEFIYTVRATVETTSLFYSSPAYPAELSNPILASIVTLRNQGVPLYQYQTFG
jgi:hypothetical protein